MGTPSLIMPSMWAVQPRLVDPRLAWFWDNATSAVIWWAGGGAPFDLVSGTVLTENNPGNLVWTVNTAGRAKEATNINGNWEVGIDTSLFPRTTHGTVLTVSRSTDITNRADYHFGLVGGGNPDRIRVHKPWSDGIVYWDWGSTGGGRISTAITKTLLVEKWAFTAGPGGLAFYKDGILRASNSTAATRTNQGQTFRINGGAGSGDLREFSLFATLDMDASAAQVRQWSHDAFGPFRMQDQVGAVFAVPAAGGSADIAPSIIQRRRRAA